jgi:hypothetical protein
MERLGAPNNVVQQASALITASAGYQTSTSYSMFSVPQLQYLLGQVSGNLPRRVVAESLTNEFTFTNFSNSPVEIDIYDIVPKRDIAVAYTFNTPSGLYTVSPFPESYWAQGLAAQNNAATTTAPALNYYIGTNPTDSILFRQFFGIKKRTTVLLPISGAHRHVVNVRCQKLIDTYLAAAGNTGSAGYSGVKGFTNYMMFNIKGLPAWNTGDPDPTTASVTTSGTQVGIVSVSRINWTYVADITYATSITAGLTHPANSFVHTFNPGSGADNATANLV